MRRASVCAVVSLAVLGAAAAPSSAAGEGVQEARYALIFEHADQTFVFGVQKAQGAGALTVDTRDCCVVGDRWSSTVSASRPSGRTATGVGSGSTTEYSGAATVAPFVSGTVEVAYASGADDFPALVCVRLAYGKASGMVVDAPPQAVLEPGC